MKDTYSQTIRSFARGFKTSAGVRDRDGRSEGEVGDGWTPLEKGGSFLADGVEDGANRLTES